MEKTFNEQSLREAIIEKWGSAGAHIDVFDELVKRAKEETPTLRWVKCPKCDGQGMVSRPPHIPGDVNEWVASESSYTCNLCNGKMIVPEETHSSLTEGGKVHKHGDTVDEILSKHFERRCAGYSYSNVMNTEGFAQDVLLAAKDAMQDYAEAYLPVGLSVSSLPSPSLSSEEAAKEDDYYKRNNIFPGSGQGIQKPH